MILEYTAEEFKKKFGLPPSLLDSVSNNPQIKSLMAEVAALSNKKDRLDDC